MLRTGNSRSRCGGDGFTLLELILVLVVIGLVVAITYPSITRGKMAFQLRAAARDVISIARYAREAAVTEQKVMVVAIDRDAGRITVSDEAGEGEKSYMPPQQIAVLGCTPAGEIVEQGPWSVRFLPNGSAEDAQILVRSDTGASLKIAVEAITGSARLAADAGGVVR